MPKDETFAGRDTQPIQFNGAAFVHHVGEDGVTVYRAHGMASIALRENPTTGENDGIIFQAEITGMTAEQYAAYCADWFIHRGMF